MSIIKHSKIVSISRDKTHKLTKDINTKAPRKVPNNQLCINKNLYFQALTREQIEKKLTLILKWLWKIHLNFQWGQMDN
jgi:hypothetical protein